MSAFLLSLLMGAGKLLRAALSFARRYPWQALVIALLCACVWLWTGWNGALDDLKSCQDGRASDHRAYVAAQKEAEAKAIKAKADAEAHYRDLAERADHEADKAIAQAHTDAERYIATHRLRVTTGSPGGTLAAPESGGAGIHQDMPADPVVLAESDVQACAGWVAFGLRAREWALSLGN